MDGKLFSQDFLLDGIRGTPVWEALPDDALNAFCEDLKRIYAPFTLDSTENEQNTIAEVIEKVLDLLGWQDLTSRELTTNKTGREDVPDFLLFPDAPAKQCASAEKRPDRRYRHGVAILEAKRWMRPLDRGDATNRLDPGTPSIQILRYLSSVEVASERKVRWGILTNGAVDALFFQLYGLSHNDAAYILDTFPIVREHDEKAHGRYLTKELILAYMNAVAAGDLTTRVRI